MPKKVSPLSAMQCSKTWRSMTSLRDWAEQMSKEDLASLCGDAVRLLNRGNPKKRRTTPYPRRPKGSNSDVKHLLDVAKWCTDWYLNKLVRESRWWVEYRQREVRGQAQRQAAPVEPGVLVQPAREVLVSHMSVAAAASDGYLSLVTEQLRKQLSLHPEFSLHPERCAGSTAPTAAGQPRKCCACGSVIPAGFRMDMFLGSDGEGYIGRICQECYASAGEKGEGFTERLDDKAVELRTLANELEKLSDRADEADWEMIPAHRMAEIDAIMDGVTS